MSVEFHQNTPGGVEHAGIIDALTQEPDGTVVMVMVERRPWDGSHERLFQLQEKLNAYLSFALDGEMTDAYPKLADKPLRIRLDCLTRPDPETAHMLGVVQEQIGFQEIGLEINIFQKGCGGGDCSCH